MSERKSVPIRGPRDVFWLIRDTIKQWDDDRARLMGAALAFYSVFSMAPLLVISLWIGSKTFGREETIERILFEVEDSLGDQATEPVRMVLENAWTGERDDLGDAARRGRSAVGYHPRFCKPEARDEHRCGASLSRRSAGSASWSVPEYSRSLGCSFWV